MIKIIKLRIKNYKSCLDTSIDFDNKLTALIGVNGVGKSNILTAIKLLSRIRSNRYFHSDKIIDESLFGCSVDLVLLIEDIEYDLKIKLTYETDQSNHDEVFNADFKIKKRNDKKWLNLDRDLVQFLYRFNGQIPVQMEGVLARRSVYNEKCFSDKKITKEIINFLNNISYYGATHFSDPSKCPNSIELEDSRPVNSYRYGRTHDKFLFDLYSIWKTRLKDSKFNKYLNLINKNGVNLIDDIKFNKIGLPTSSYEIITGGKVKKINKNKDVIIPTIILDGLNLSPNQLSEGTFKTLALLFYIINDDTNLLIIEEPEVCVHHGLLSSIIELIKSESKHKQIIISTHSDYVLDKLKPENVLFVSRNDKKGTEVKKLSKLLSKNDYNALKHYLNNTGNLGEYWKEGGLKND